MKTTQTPVSPLYKAMLDDGMIGCIKDAPPDLAKNLSLYLGGKKTYKTRHAARKKKAA